MKIIKRDGKKQEYNQRKVIKAIQGAMDDINFKSDKLAEVVGNRVEEKLLTLGKNEYTVEEIQDLVEKELMSKNKDVAKQYIVYRYKHKLVRESNTTDKQIKELLEGDSEYWNTENSNKNAKEVTTQRDYIAGITSTDIAKRFLLPKDVVKAHEEGVIHQHDMDYLAQFALTNCCLINLEDMLQNGTVINNVQIEPQHRLLTAVTVATQIITAVASSQYGLR